MPNRVHAILWHHRLETPRSSEKCLCWNVFVSARYQGYATSEDRLRLCAGLGHILVRSGRLCLLVRLFLSVSYSFAVVQNAEVLANGKIRIPAYLDLPDLLPALHSFYQKDNEAWRPKNLPSISTLRQVVREKFPHLVTPLG